MVVSAMSLTGMNTVNVGDLNTTQQVIIYFLMILGSPLLISIAVLYFRKRATHDKYFADLTPRNSGKSELSKKEQTVLIRLVRNNSRDRKPRGPGPEIWEMTNASPRRPQSRPNFLLLLKSSLGGESQTRYGLSREERQELGRIEERALKLLLYLVPTYLIFFPIVGTAILAPCIALNRPETAISNGVNPW